MAGIMILILPVAGLVGASNLSTAIIILGIGVILVFIASPRYGQFIWMGVVGCGFMAVFLAMESYRLERLAIWRNPEAYEKGYQTLAGGSMPSARAACSDGGLGNSVQKLAFCSRRRRTEHDLLHHLRGAGTFWRRLYPAALSHPDLAVLRYCQQGAGSFRGAHCRGGHGTGRRSQVILNIAVVTNTIPNTGITLPFVSYGGTSVVFLLLEMGLVLSVSSLVK